MERLKDEVLNNAIKTYEISSKIDDPDYSTVLDKCVLEFLYELKEYRNAEEHGLLIRLPVAEGSTVYILGYIYECKHDYECVLKHDKFICEEDVHCEHEEKIWRVKEAVFNYRMVENIGKTVFLTREEAEKALEEMEG